MKNRFLYVLFISIISISSCFKPNNGGDFFSQALITYTDSSGNPLFTNGQNGYFQDSVRLYDFENGVKTLLTSPSNMYPYGYYFSGSSSTIVIGLSTMIF
jgi:hypothetical protein